MSKLQAVILAGGKGSRLKPYTTIVPKPLLPIGEYSIIEIIIRQLKFFGFTEIFITTGHLAELIEAFLGDGRRWGVRIKYLREEKPLGTAGALKLIPGLQENFLVINGDTLTDINFKKIFDLHKKLKGLGTIVVKKVVTKNDFGVVDFDKNSLLTSYIEKPESEAFISLGINILNRGCTEYIKPKEYLGMPDLMLRMKNAQEKIYCFQTKDTWFDLGRMQDLQAAQDVFDKSRSKFFRE